jgi:hypothetical protein
MGPVEPFKQPGSGLSVRPKCLGRQIESAIEKMAFGDDSGVSGKNPIRGVGPGRLVDSQLETTQSKSIDWQARPFQLETDRHGGEHTGTACEGLGLDSTLEGSHLDPILRDKPDEIYVGTFGTELGMRS